VADCDSCCAGVEAVVGWDCSGRSRSGICSEADVADCGDSCCAGVEAVASSDCSRSRSLSAVDSSGSGGLTVVAISGSEGLGGAAASSLARTFLALPPPDATQQFPKMRVVAVPLPQ